MPYSNEQVLNKIMDLVSKGYTVRFEKDIRDDCVRIRLTNDGFSYAYAFALEDVKRAWIPFAYRVVDILEISEKEFEYFKDIRQSEAYQTVQQALRKDKKETHNGFIQQEKSR